MEYEQYVTEYSKKYDENKKKIFLKNLEVIKENNIKYNNGTITWESGINKFTDLSDQEFLKIYGTGLIIDSSQSNQIVKKNIKKIWAFNNTTNCKRLLCSSSTKKSQPTIPSPSLPTSFDWRNNNVVTPVVDQGKCGCCWAISAVGALEGAYAIKYNNLKRFSFQQLISCSLNANKYLLGCGGGNPVKAYDWIKNNNGLCSYDEYPFTDKGGSTSQCLQKNCTINVDLIKKSIVIGDVSNPNIARLSENDLINALIKYGPLSVGVSLWPLSGWKLYKSGILSDSTDKYPCPLGPAINHSVLLVGYGQEKINDVDIKYWLVKNSWGTDWGENGYVKLMRGGCPTGKYYYGHFGIFAKVSVPVL